jgi:hypothetical protein
MFSLGNNAKIDWDVAGEIRMRRNDGLSLGELMKEFNLPQDIVWGVISNATFTDHAWTDLNKREASGTILIPWEGGEITLTRLSEVTGIPKVTLDRRWREGRRGGDLTAPARKKMESITASLIRRDYKDGLKGQPLYDKYESTKAAVMQILSNRTFQEDTIWWK